MNKNESATMTQRDCETKENAFVGDLQTIVSAARETCYRMVNLMQVVQNWLIGRRIVEQEQQGKARAGYGKHVIELASKSLTEMFGQGFSETQIRNFRKFYLSFSNLQIQQALPVEFKARLASIQQTASAESVHDGLTLPVQLSWSHYERLIRVADPEARMWYMQESATQQWDYRTLKRNIDSQYYYRLVQTPAPKKQEVIDEMYRLTADYEKEKSVFVKNPMLVEFLGLKQSETFTESKLEHSILNHLERFMMEMGKGYALVERQMHIHTEDVARFSTLASNKQMYASKYLTYMPSKEVLAREIEQQKEIFRLQHNSDES